MLDGFAQRAVVCAMGLMVAATAAASVRADQAAPAAAGQAFVACDGYGAPDAASDGMVRLTRTYGMLGAPKAELGARGEMAAGAAGVDACESALAVLPEKDWMRRVSLLRARAYHRLQQGDAAAALADLDLADRTGAQGGDEWYARSLAQGDGFLRAYALVRKGDEAAAETVVGDTISARPYERGTAKAALLALGSKVSARTAEQLRRYLVRLDPGADTASGVGQDGAALAGLWRAFPDPETAVTAPGFHAARLPLALFGAERHAAFGAGGEGYSSFGPDASGVIAVRFKSVRAGAAAIVAELALLHAADVAIKQGRPGFIIVGRTDAEQAQGFETELRIVAVDREKLPSEYADMPWRVIDASLVRLRLGSVYDPSDAVGIW